MCKSCFGLALATLFAFNGTALADPQTYDFHFVNPGGVTWNGVYVNPYTASSSAGKLLTIYCDDWNTDFSGTPSWNADVYTLKNADTDGDLEKFRYGNSTYDQYYDVTLNASGKLVPSQVTPLSQNAKFIRYLEAAYLDSLAQTIIASHPASDDAQIELAAAVWTLFVDTAHVGSSTSGLIGAINSWGYSAAVAGYLDQAHKAVAVDKTFDGTGWHVIVPYGKTDAQGGMQEFLVHAPEPNALILLCSVIGLLALAKFRRKAQS